MAGTFGGVGIFYMYPGVFGGIEKYSYSSVGIARPLLGAPFARTLGHVLALRLLPCSYLRTAFLGYMVQAYLIHSFTHGHLHLLFIPNPENT